MKKYILAFFVFTWFGIQVSAAPACLDNKKPMTYNHEKLLNLRESMPKKFTARAYVRGKIVRVMEDRQNHIHFEVDFDGDFQTSDDRLEVIYNRKFGPVPDFRSGESLIACGDFVIDPYSPTKAVVHWLHINPHQKGHDHGFLIINGILTGQEASLKR